MAIRVPSRALPDEARVLWQEVGQIMVHLRSAIDRRKCVHNDCEQWEQLGHSMMDWWQRVGTSYFPEEMAAEMMGDASESVSVR